MRGPAFRRFPERERRVSASRSFALRNGRSDHASASPRPRACHATRVTAGRLNQAEDPHPVKPNETSGQTGVAENYPPLPGLSLSLSLEKKMDERAEPETAEQSRLPLFPPSLSPSLHGKPCLNRDCFGDLLHPFRGWVLLPYSTREVLESEPAPPLAPVSP